MDKLKLLAIYGVGLSTFITTKCIVDHLIDKMRTEEGDSDDNSFKVIKSIIYEVGSSGISCGAVGILYHTLLEVPFKF